MKKLLLLVVITLCSQALCATQGATAKMRIATAINVLTTKNNAKPGISEQSIAAHQEAKKSLIQIHAIGGPGHVEKFLRNVRKKMDIKIKRQSGPLKLPRLNNSHRKNLREAKKSCRQALNNLVATSLTADGTNLRLIIARNALLGIAPPVAQKPTGTKPTEAVATPTAAPAA